MTSKIKVQKQSERAKPNNCAHHWSIGAVVDGTAPGICLLCHEERQFRDYVPLNFNSFCRLNYNMKIRAESPSVFRCMEDFVDHFEVAHSKPKKEEPMKAVKLSGGDIVARAKVLRPARNKAKELFRQGKDGITG
jgi:hypothetical protein